MWPELCRGICASSNMEEIEVGRVAGSGTVGCLLGTHRFTAGVSLAWVTSTVSPISISPICRILPSLSTIDGIVHNLFVILL